ncbi:MAG: hypothetical protein ACLR1N_02200 [Bifidobacterium pseudocatenulatum]
MIDMPEIVECATFDRKYEGIAKYPAVTRDISMVVPKNILVGQIEEVIENKGGATSGKLSVVRSVRRSPDQTGLTSLWLILSHSVQKTELWKSADVSAAMDKILKASGSNGY